MARRKLVFVESPRPARDTNITLRVDADVLLWARARAWFGGTSVNALIRGFLAEYAAFPKPWLERQPPPWTPEDRIRPVIDPRGAGRRAPGADPASGEAIRAVAAAARLRQG